MSCTRVEKPGTVVEVVTMTLLALVVCPSCTNAEDLTPEGLSEHIRQNESLYLSAVDATVEKRVTVDPDVIADPVSEGRYGTFLAYQSFDQTLHYVFQDDRFYFNDRTVTIFAKSNNPEHADLPAQQEVISEGQYDGEKTTYVQGDSVANIFNYRQDGLVRMFPHQLLFDTGLGRSGRLWEYIRGYEYAMTVESIADAAPNFFEVTNIKSVDDENERKIEFDIVSYVSEDKREVFGKVTLRLNATRNYIPERCELYSPEYAGMTRPFGVGEVVEWDEVKPGIWIPLRTNLEIYINGGDNTDTKIYDRWRRKVEYEVKKFSFQPTYEDGYFSQVSIPEGTQVNVVDEPPVSTRSDPSEEKPTALTRSQKKGALINPQLSTGNTYILWSVLTDPLVITIVVSFAGAITVWAVKHRKLAKVPRA